MDLPVISLPQREQNMRASYPSHRGSQAEYPWRIARAVADGTGSTARQATVQGDSGVARPMQLPDRASKLRGDDPSPEPSARPETAVVPYHTIAFSQQKLRAALRRAAGQDPAFTYGFVVHSRRYSDQPTLGLITLHGESLPLNERLLKALDGAAALAVRPRPDHPRVGDAASSAAENSKADPMDRPLVLAADAHRHLRHQHRRHPAPGAGRGPGARPRPWCSRCWS